jgi:hypothetical protein
MFGVCSIPTLLSAHVTQHGEILLLAILVSPPVIVKGNEIAGKVIFSPNALTLVIFKNAFFFKPRLTLNSSVRSTISLFQVFLDLHS